MADSRSLSYCAAQVHDNDRDRFLCTLFAPADRREDLFALLAFNSEIARTRELVSDTTLGLIRLQWWREAVTGTAAGAQDQAIVTALRDAIDRHRIAPEDLITLVDAREFDLVDRPPADLSELEDYVGQSAAAVTVLCARMLGAESDAALEAARRVGMAYGLAGVLRAVVFHAHQRRLMLPEAESDAAGLETGALFELKSSPALRQVSALIAARAAEHLRRARALRHAHRRATLAALLPATLAEHYLRRLRQNDHDPLAPQFGLARPSSWRLTWAALLGRY